MTVSDLNPVPKQPKVLPTQLKLSEYIRRDWFLSVPDGLTADDLLTAGPWVHVVRSLQKHDIIEAVAADSSWYARLLVRHVAGPDVRMGLLEEVTFKEQAALVEEPLVAA